MTRKNQERDEDAINAELFGNDQKRWEDGGCTSYAKQLNVEPHGLGYGGVSSINRSSHYSSEKVKYISKSNPERSIYISPNYAYRAEKIVEFALRSLDMNMLVEKVSLYPSLTGMYIPDKVLDLMVNKEESLKSQDIVYLETCLHMAKDDLSKNNIGCAEFPWESGFERLQKIKNVENIKNMLESL